MEASREAHLDALLFPVLGMRENPAFDVHSVHAAFDVLIFVSPSAVQFGSAFIDRANERALVVAVGETTRRALKSRNVVALCPPGESSSESVLAMPEMARVARAHRVVLVRGVGGRDLMVEMLRQRGAEVVVAEVYERFCPTPSLVPLVAAHKADKMPFVVLTSAQSVANFVALLSNDLAEWLRACAHVLTYSERLGKHVRAAGFTGPVTVLAPGDNAALVRLVAAR
jgi:uroporphyrinogen-III synthase